MLPDDVRSILLIRLSAIGDVLMASPVPEALRARYPQARISWLVEKGIQPVLEGNPFIDEVIVWEKGHWKDLLRRGRLGSLIGEVRRFVRGLRARGFEAVIDMQGLLKSGVWAGLSGAPVRIGLGSREGSGLFMSRLIHRPESWERISSQYLHLVRELGIDPGGFFMHMPVGEADRRFADIFVRENHLGGGYVACAPFTTRPQKHWLSDRWPEVARRLHEEQGLKTLLLGGPSDAPAAESMVAACPTCIVSAAGTTSLSQAAALIEGGQALAGVDTGLTHMGIALGVPTVAIFGSTCPYTATARENAVVLYSGEACSPCRRSPTCDGAYQCMAAITVGGVMTGLQSVMGEEATRR